MVPRAGAAATAGQGSGTRAAPPGEGAAESELEGDVVVAGGRAATAARGRAGGLEVARVGGNVGARREAVAAAHVVVAAAEELHGVGHDVDRLALVAVGVFPLAPLEAAVDGHRPALG